jgi:hypothetical protein
MVSASRSRGCSCKFDPAFTLGTADDLPAAAIFAAHFAAPLAEAQEILPSIKRHWPQITVISNRDNVKLECDLTY